MLASQPPGARELYRRFITRKYLFSRPFITLVATVFVALSTFMLIVVQAVMGGFRVELRERIRGTLSHLMVEDRHYLNLPFHEEILEAVKGVEHYRAAAPYIEAVSIFSRQGVKKCLIRGIDPALECGIGELQEYLLRGDEFLDQLRSRYHFKDSQVLEPPVHKPFSVEEVEDLFSLQRRREILHRKLVKYPELRDAIGDRIPQALVCGIELALNTGLLPGEMVELVTVSVPRSNEFEVRKRWFIVTGYFQSGSYEYDANYAYVHLNAAKEFVNSFDEELQDYRVSGVSVKLDDFHFAEAAKTAIEKAVRPIAGTAMVNTWEDHRKNLLAAVNIEKAILLIILFILVPFAGTIIALILTLLVIEKTRDLGILLALGATPGGIIKIFLMNGLSICVTGLTCGFVGGVLLCQNINTIHDWITAKFGVSLFPKEIYYLDEIPVKIALGDLAWVIIPMVVFAFLLSLFPAYLASRRDPIHSLRYE